MEPMKEGKEDDDKDLDQKDVCNLLINYLPKSWTENELKNLFFQYGNVVYVKVVRNRVTKESECYGFVRYDQPQSAQSAIEHLNGYQVQNKRLKVQVSAPASLGSDRANLYVAGFPADWTDTQLGELVKPYGQPVEIKILYNLQTQKSRQCGFVRMNDHNQAVAVIQGLNNKPAHGRTLVVRFSDKPREAAARKQLRMKPFAPLFNPMVPNYHQSPPVPFPTPSYSQPLISSPGQKPPGVCLFVYHLPPSASPSDLYQLFSNYGQVVSCKVMKDSQTGRSKGYGFVNMLHQNQADVAIQALNGHRMGSKFLQVSYKV